MEWQPIATAPKDGTNILILTETGIVQAWYAAGEWSGGHEYEEYNGPAWVCYDDEFEIEIEETPEGDFSKATHWMPLPEPPKC